MARLGIAQALGELVAEGWIGRVDVPSLARLIMNGNAREVFPAR